METTEKHVHVTFCVIHIWANKMNANAKEGWGRKLVNSVDSCCFSLFWILRDSLRRASFYAINFISGTAITTTIARTGGWSEVEGRNTNMYVVVMMMMMIMPGRDDDKNLVVLFLCFVCTKSANSNTNAWSQWF